MTLNSTASKSCPKRCLRLELQSSCPDPNPVSSRQHLGTGAWRKLYRDSAKHSPVAKQRSKINTYCLDSPERVAACHLIVVSITKLASPRRPCQGRGMTQHSGLVLGTAACLPIHSLRAGALDVHPAISPPLAEAHGLLLLPEPS